MKFTFNRDIRKKPESLKISHLQADAEFLITDRLREFFLSAGHNRDIVVVCVGTDRSTGDCLGPLVGTNLEQRPSAYAVYGTLAEPVHAMNLQETIDDIRVRHPASYVVAVDACLGQLGSVGCIQVCDGPVKPGAGVNKQLPPVGDMHITGIVNVGGFMEYFVLQNTRLNLVFTMAGVIANALHRAIGTHVRPAAVATTEINPIH